MKSRININFTDDELLYLRTRAEAEEVTMTEIIRRAVRLDKCVTRNVGPEDCLAVVRSGRVMMEIVR